MRDVADEVPRWERGLAWAVRAALIAMAVFHAVTGDYLLVGYCLLALGILLVPPMLARSSGANVPVELELVVVVLVVADMILGKWFGLYDRLVYWDKVLHLGESGLLGFLGFLVLFVLRSTGRLRVSVGISIAIATWLTLGLGAAWEIGEYAMDQIFGTATQGSPVALPLDDTMWDLIFDAIGGFVGGSLGVVYLHRSARARRVARWFHA
jgi:hypothetical protein